MDRRDELADERDRIAGERDDAADASDRRQDALDRREDERDQVALAALFEEATGALDRKAIDQALSKIDWQAQVRGREVAMRQGRRFVSLLTAMDNIRDARHELEQAQRQRGAAR